MNHAEFCLARTQSRTVFSRGGREYRIWIAAPSEPAPPQGFPVIYVLDANAIFATVVESLRIRARRGTATGVHPAVVVGIGYPGSEPFDTARRTFDYTHGPSIEGQEAPGATGGAAAFLEFLETTVKPQVAGKLPVDPIRQTLFSHSLAGFFGLGVLLHSPFLFQTHLIVSPSIWWNPPYLFERIQAFRDSTPDLARKTDVMVAVAEYDQRPAPWLAGPPASSEAIHRRASRRVVDSAREISAALAVLPGIGRSTFHEFPGEDHVSVLLPAVNNGLRFACGC